MQKKEKSLELLTYNKTEELSKKTGRIYVKIWSI